jgi:hypothetical protein
MTANREPMTEIRDLHNLLDQVSFSLKDTFLTERQAQVLTLREFGLTQSEIAERFGTTRANITNIESSARDNLRAARKTIELNDILSSPVQVRIPAGTDIFEIPDTIYEACDDADVKADCSAVELVKRLRTEKPDAIEQNTVQQPLRVIVSSVGDVRVYSTFESLSAE